VAQDPTQVDALQVEPAATGTRLIDRDPSDDSLRFFDPFTLTGSKLKDIAGIQTLAGVLIVAKSGLGATYTTITSALNAVPLTASDTNPWAILVTSGVYQENLLIQKNGVLLIPLGLVILQSATESTPNVNPADTITIQEGGGTVPEWVTLRNFTVTNAHDGYSCVRVIGSAGSDVGKVGIDLIDNDLVANGVGGHPIKADSMNILNVQGGTWGSSSSTSLAVIEEVAVFKTNGVREITGLQLDYDTTEALPSTLGSEYEIQGSNSIGKVSTLAPPVSSTLSGDGSLRIANCGSVGEVRLFGDRTFEGLGTDFGDLQIQNTVAATLVGSRRGTVLGTGTLAEPVTRGSLTFAGTSQESATFDVEHPDTNYVVVPELNAGPAGDAWPTINPKSTTGFTVDFRNSGGAPIVQTMTVNYAVIREV